MSGLQRLYQCRFLKAALSSAVVAVIDKDVPVVIERLFNTFAEGPTEMSGTVLNGLVLSYPVAAVAFYS